MMIHKKPTKTRQQQNLKKLPQLTQLKLEQLESLAGGGGDPSGGVPDSGPDGRH